MLESIKKSIVLGLCDSIKFCYGFIFGTFLWALIVKPYTRYYNFEYGHYWPEFVFSLATGLVFMASEWARSLMVLFLPSLIGTATQNIIIVVLFGTLLANPAASIGANAVESTRVIGCSLTMAFELIKERAKLILNPMIELMSEEKLNNRTNDISDHIRDIQATVNEIGNRMQVIQGEQVNNWPEAVPMSTNKSSATLGKSEVDESKNKLAKLGFDSDKLQLKGSIDVKQLGKLLNTSSVAITRNNFTNLMFDSCLEIFRSAKNGCDEVTGKLQAKCENDIGYLMAQVWCTPIFGSTELICPTLISQLVDEKTICNQMRNTSLWKIDSLIDWKSQSAESNSTHLNITSLPKKSLQTQPIGGKNRSDINDLFDEMNWRVHLLNQELATDGLGQNNSLAPQRIELSISLNDKTMEVFVKTSKLIEFLGEKYKLRRYLLNILLLCYDIYSTFTFVSIAYQAWQYRQAYLREIKFNNCYITSTFIEMDDRHRSTKVLPLTKEEEKKYVTTFTCKRRTKEERRYQSASCASIAMFLVFTLSLMYLDDIFYSILNSIRNHALIEYHEKGHHELEVIVKGQGSLAQLIQRLTHRLNSAYKLDRNTTTSTCLPVPQRTNSRFYTDFVLLVLSYCLIDQVSIYAMRLRRFTCAYFYPEKERQRLIYLRKLILFQRKRDTLSADNSSLTSSIDGSGSFSSHKDDGTLQRLIGDENGEILYTARDALEYLAECASDSYARCRWICNNSLVRKLLQFDHT